MAKNIVNENVTSEEIKETETRQPITFEEFKEKVKITKYIPINAKRMIIDTVKNNCIYEQDGMYYIDYIDKEISCNLAMLSFYTDFVTDEVNTYDHLDKIGVFNYIHSTIEFEFYYMIEDELHQRVDTLNSTGAVITRTLNDFINKVPSISSLKDILNDLPKTFNEVNPETLKIFAKELNNGTVQNQVANKDNKLKIIND